MHRASTFRETSLQRVTPVPDASEGDEDYGAQSSSYLSPQIINSSHVP